MSKMYILVKRDISIGYKAVAIAHASLAAYLTFKDDTITQDWVINSFKKVIVEVSNEEFEIAKSFGEYKLITESSLDNMELALGFKPMEKVPTFFKMLILLS